MAGRRPGPPPKDPSTRRRSNADPLIAQDGWTELSAAPYQGKVPPIPEWVGVDEVGQAVYRELSRLPQAVEWGPGTWFELHLTLPLVQRYLARPGAENFKAIVSTLGAALSLTEDDLQRARKRWRRNHPDGADGEPVSSPVVTDIRARRQRLTG